MRTGPWREKGMQTVWVPAYPSAPKLELVRESRGRDFKIEAIAMATITLVGIIGIIGMYWGWW